MNVKDLVVEHQVETAIIDEVLDNLSELAEKYPHAIKELFRQETARLVNVSTRFDGRVLHTTYSPSEYLNGFAEALATAVEESIE